MVCWGKCWQQNFTCYGLRLLTSAVQLLSRTLICKQKSNYKANRKLYLLRGQIHWNFWIRYRRAKGPKILVKSGPCPLKPMTEWENNFISSCLDFKCKKQYSVAKIWDINLIKWVLWVGDGRAFLITLYPHVRAIFFLNSDYPLFLNFLSLFLLGKQLFLLKPWTELIK